MSNKIIEKFCRVPTCGVKLTAGENWLPSQVKQRNYICRACHATIMRAHDLANPAPYLMRCLRRNHPDIPATQEDVQRLIDAVSFDGSPLGLCPVFGEPLTIVTGRGKGSWSATIDLLVPGSTSVSDLVLLSSKANSAKNCYGVERLLQAAAYLSQDGPPEQADEVATAGSRRWLIGVWHSRMSATARARGVRSFGFTRDELAVHVKRPRFCPCCHIELSYEQGVGQRPNQASIDCFDPTDDAYLPGRFATVCMACNVVMSNLSAGELFALAEWLSIELTSRGHQCPFRGASLFAQHYLLPLAA